MANELVEGGPPYLDEKIKHVGVSKLREMNAAKLRELDGLFVIQDGNEPLSVIVPYETFLEMQRHVTLGIAEIERRWKEV